MKSLKISRRISADIDADAIAFDKATGHILVIEGDPGAITVLDPQTDAVAATIKVGEKLEFGVADGQGAMYVAGEEKGDVVRIDTRANSVVAHWAAAGCESPHGLALDTATHRLFMGCTNSLLVVMNAENGGVVAKLPIGRGSDAVAYDPTRHRVFSSNGLDGTVSVFQQVGADRYRSLAPIKTKVSGRTMAIDPASGRLFVAAADTDPNPVAGGRPITRPGTLNLLVFEPRPVS